MANEADQRTRLCSVSDLFAYHVSFKSDHNYGGYRMTKNRYVCVYQFSGILFLIIYLESKIFVLRNLNMNQMIYYRTKMKLVPVIMDYCWFYIEKIKAR